MSPRTRSLLLLASIVAVALAVRDAGAVGQPPKVVVEGKIDGIAEIDPPRLYLKVGKARQTVVVPVRTTKVTWKDHPLEFNDLRPGDQVRVTGVRPDADKKGPITAKSIHILKRAAPPAGVGKGG